MKNTYSDYLRYLRSDTGSDADKVWVICNLLLTFELEVFSILCAASFDDHLVMSFTSAYRDAKPYEFAGYAAVRSIPFMHTKKEYDEARKLQVKLLIYLIETAV
jgi:hypothetical protein